MKRSKLAVGVFLWACIPMAVLLWFLTTLWPQAPGIAASQPVNERTGMALVIVLGAIGGYIRWMQYLAHIVDDPENVWQWLMDSALTPLKGAALALIFCIAVRAGLTTGSAQGTSGNVNWMGLYGLAGIAGIFSPDVVKRLEVTFQALFMPHSPAHRTQSSSEAEKDDKDKQGPHGSSAV